MTDPLDMPDDAFSPIGPTKATADAQAFQVAAQAAVAELQARDPALLAWAVKMRKELEAEWWRTTSEAPPMDDLDRVILTKTAAAPGWSVADDIEDVFRPITGLRILLHRRQGTLLSVDGQKGPRAILRPDYEARYERLLARYPKRAKARQILNGAIVLVKELTARPQQTEAGAKRLTTAVLPPTLSDLQKIRPRKLSKSGLKGAIKTLRNNRIIYAVYSVHLTEAGRALVRSLYGVEALPQWWEGPC